MKLLRILGKRGRVTIPYEIRQRVHFQYNDILSFTESDDGRSIIVKRERLCDCHKATQNLQQEKRDEEITLFDFLNNLSPDQQRAALVHLSVKWAENQSEKENQEE